MTSLKPYLIRSIYEWIIDNNLTPHLLVDATHPHAVLPKDYIEDNKIVLNMRPEAIQGLSLENTTVEFNARFNGQPMHIIAPIPAVMAIYAKENGKGMVFDQEEEEDSTLPPDTPTPPTRTHLRVVK
ncbi:MAG: ClpXP protease specificity-enhancing factor [Gammaproteobacteria bacterium]|jgi:stringent starvation protein B|nr:ClpXP protease specificity-enhancing factor [Gammaproteobacteria bacterium]MBT5222237.1 ClpXP protease specificity-enhancing factor [Gammaproteobacteria bacterium]MBT5826714.1 ClpXP protease specificity-enhancing factor [Gammaproteobacteria bacterium]MBT5966672.1 ClpXP protease specificity-enhancing factor [Gammaproteobacteria bacterium]MBT6420079.1 ClpXP protease specificity-enhancing factor [Gammaproteobacteria bacterium]